MLIINLNCRGCKLSDTPSDIKKAYRKAALKHHPDKVYFFLDLAFQFVNNSYITVTHLTFFIIRGIQAGQFLARSDSGDEGRLWKEISLEVNKDADRLFKMIGEAYTVLSDPTKVCHPTMVANLGDFYASFGRIYMHPSGF